MKKNILIAIVFILGFFVSPIVTAAIILNTDDVFEFEFTTLAFDSFSDSGPGWDIFGLTGDATTSGGEFYLELFEDDLEETPFFTDYFVQPNLWPEEYGFAAKSNTDRWQDIQGVIRLTMISGSLSLNKLYFEVSTDDSVYQEMFVPVPEPATLCLLTFGGLFLRKRRV